MRILVAAALGATALAGCSTPTYTVVDERAEQRGAIGTLVEVRATAAQAGGDGASIAALTEDAGLQLLAGFLVPEGTTPPATVTGRLPSALGEGSVTFSRRVSLDESLQATRPAAAGRRWVGFASPVLGVPADVHALSDAVRHVRHAADADAPRDTGDDDGRWTVAGDFRFAHVAGSLPVPGSFEHAVVTGVRVAYPQAIATGTMGGPEPGGAAADWVRQLADARPVDCAERTAFPGTELYGTRLPAGLLPTTSCGPTSAGGSIVLRDIAGAGGVVTAPRGATVQVPFALRYVGAPGPSFAVTAATTLPGAVATAGLTTLAPSAAGFTDVPVTITVPDGAQPGTYAVELTLSAGDDVRHARGQLTVPVGPAGPDGVLIFSVHGLDATGAGRRVQFRGLDVSGPAADGRSIDLGDVLCRKPRGSCDHVEVQLAVRSAELRPAGSAAAAPRRARLSTLARVRLAVPAGGRRRARVTVGPVARRMLASGRVIRATVKVRSAPGRAPIVHHMLLRRG